jgi:SEC-C motif-containing protein
MSARDAKDACPCGTGRPYPQCCEPYHRGGEPPDAASLMRSRFAAFAKGEVDYLWRTLHPDHDDRGGDRAAYLAHLRRGLGTLRYAALQILDTRDPDQEGIAQVLFHAEVWDKGKDHGFVELSSFAHDGEGWRYLFGAAVPRSKLRVDPKSLTIGTFEPPKP